MCVRMLFLWEMNQQSHYYYHRLAKPSQAKLSLAKPPYASIPLLYSSSYLQYAQTRGKK